MEVEANKAAKVLQELLQDYLDQCSTEIEGSAASLFQPPKNTILRINTALTDVDTAKSLIDDLLSESGFSPVLIPNLAVIEIPALGPYTVTPSEKRVIVDSGCAAAVLRGSEVFIAGILAMDPSVRKGERVAIWADVDKRCLKGYKKDYSGSSLFIANGVAIVDRDDIFVRGVSQGIAIRTQECTWKMPPFSSLPDEMFIPQNLPSIVAVEELRLKPGMTVLDMCASPGGKSSHIGALLKDSGLLLAIDRNSRKVAKLASTLKRLGITCARPLVFDSAQLCHNDDELGEAVNPEDFHGLAGQRIKLDSFDRILLDPPCSGIGQRPILSSDSLKHYKNDYASYQLRLLKTAFRLLRPGGILVYSTCTLSPRENEEIVGKALKYCDLELVLPKFNLGAHGLKFSAYQYPNQYVRRFWPSDPGDSIAFFYAVFRKN